MVLRARIIILWNIMFCNLCMRELVSLGKHFIKWEQVCAERVCTNTPPRTMYALPKKTPEEKQQSSVRIVHKLGHDCEKRRCSQRLGKGVCHVFGRGQALRSNDALGSQLAGVVVLDLDVFVGLVVHGVEHHPT